MNRSTGNSHKSLIILPILVFAAPVTQATASPRLSLETGGQNTQNSASAPRLIAQILPTPDATQTQLSVDASGQQFEISGGIQAGENVFHRFDKLDLAAGQTANFRAASAVEAIFSQIDGGTSSINGRLKVSGSGADLFLLNPSGILFGPSAQLELGGSFVATTADRLQFGNQWIDLLEDGITAETTLAGSLNALEFSVDAGGGAIANQGQLAVTEGQSLGLLSHAVINTGSLTAPGGEVTVLAATAGQRLSLEGGLLRVDLPASEADTSKEYSLPSSVAQSALGEATGLSLNADDSISLQAGKTVVSGSVDVSSHSGKGGQARVLGDEVRLSDAKIDASGASGGIVHVGGDFQGRGDILSATSTQVDANSALRADGLVNSADIRPDGGEIVVWSDGTAEFAGTATARSLAAGGDGGLVETSGKQQLAIKPTSSINTTAVDGLTGQWLIDPENLTVVSSGGGGSLVGGVNPIGISSIDASIVKAGLDGNNISLQADNSITLNSPIDTSSNVSGGNVVLDAPTLILNERVTLKPGSELSGTATQVFVRNSGSIQNAVDTVVAGGTVSLFGGAVTPVIYREGQEIIVDKPISLRAPDSALTVISGDANGDGSSVGNQTDNHRILSLTSNADGTVISDITFSDAIANGEGGALVNSADDVTIENSAFLDNQVLGPSADDGGAIQNLGQRLTINNTTFTNNQAQSDGGAIDVESGSVTITNSTFIENDANAGQGGAIDVDINGSLNIRSSNFERNTSATSGGAIYTDSILKVDGTEFRSNQSQFDGGAIAAQIGPGNEVQLVDSTFADNSATRHGGGAYLDGQTGASLSLSENSFENNSALSGGGIFKTNSAVLSIVDTVFDSNNATNHGGGLAIELGGGDNTITDSNFVQNIAVGNGGGVRLSTSDVSINNSLIVGNQANTGGGIDLNNGTSADLNDSLVQGNIASTNGGAIHSDSISDITVSNSRLLNNQSGDAGGAIYASGNLLVDGSQIQNNQSSNVGGGGIALRNGGGEVTILSTTVSGNNALSGPGGGLHHVSLQNLTIRESTFSSNGSGAFNGGGLYLVPPTPGTTTQIQNSTISGNAGGTTGGGIFVGSNAQVALNNVTVANNTATSFGGGINQASAGALTIQNTIIAGNTSSTDTVDVIGSGIVSLGNNIVQNRGTSSGYIATDLPDGTDPQLVSLANNGGPTETHALRANSTAVNGGNASATVSDQRGLIAAGQRDIGAYELDDQLNLVAMGGGQSTVVGQTFANPIQVTVTDSLGAGVAGLDLDVIRTSATPSASLTPLQTNDSGIAVSTATANTAAGSYPIHFERTGSGASSSTLILTNLSDVPDLISVVDGNNQSTVVNTAFADPVKIQVTDQFGNPISGEQVNFLFLTGGSPTTVGATSLTTDAAGTVTAPLTANTVAGVHVFPVTSGGLLNSISLTNLPDVPAQLLVKEGNNQSTVVNTAFTTPLLVEVADQFGNAVPGATVELEMPNAGATAVAGATSLTTDVGGQATTLLTANTVAGSYSLALEVGSINDSVTLTNLADAPAQLDLLNGDDQSALVNTAFSDDLTVLVRDQYGNPLSDVTVTFTAPSTGASTANTNFSLKTDSVGQGQATVTANTLPGEYQLVASSGSLDQTVSLKNLPDDPIVTLSDPPLPLTEPSIAVPTTQPPSTALPPTTPTSPTIPLPATPVNPTAPVLPQPIALPVAPPTQIDKTIAVSTTQTVKEPDVVVDNPASLSWVDSGAVQAVDASFSSEYATYWGIRRGEGATIAETRQMLKRAGEAYGVRSAVLYALFVPQDSLGTEADGETRALSMSLSRQSLEQGQEQEQREDDQLMLVMVSGNGPPVQRLVNVTRKELQRQARLFRMAVADPEDAKSYKPLAQQMYRWMLEPVESEMARLKLNNVMYALAPGLRTMPLVAMMDGDEFAIEHYGISLIPSVDLLETDFGASPPEARTLAAGATEFKWLNDLPAVAIELEAIATQASASLDQRNAEHPPTQSKSVDILLNESFTQANLIKAQQSSGVKNIHLATHGEFNAGNLRHSFLQLWDGRLRLDEISDLGWDELELLILSACQTAISSPEAELGFAGLAAAAGVESTIGSLWSVSDIGTLALMSEFYGKLSQEPLRFEALRQAQLAMLQRETRLADQQLKIERGEINLPREWDLPKSADFSHPFYWSGFTLVGNPWW